jgi:hypothetical protein
MSINYGFDNIEPKAHTALFGATPARAFGGVAFVKQPRKIIRGDAGAVVGDTDGDGIVAGSIKSDIYFSLRSLIIFRGDIFDAVVNDVDQGLA